MTGCGSTLDWACSPSARVVYRGRCEPALQCLQVAAQRNWRLAVDALHHQVVPAIAVARPDGSFHLDGVQHVEPVTTEGASRQNTIYLMTAHLFDRPGEASGSRLFLVPACRFDVETGALQRRNGLFAEADLEGDSDTRGPIRVRLGGHRVAAKGWLLGQTGESFARVRTVLETTRPEWIPHVSPTAPPHP